MDPVTQGALGAAAAQLVLGPKTRRAWWLGALGGMAADLDILIQAETNPLLSIIYHRHFTHSLAFVPFGGVLVALPWLLRYRGTEHAVLRRNTFVATTTGYATHALLDAFTSYGTLLWWPFSWTRVAWNTISIIDLIYTVPLIIGVVLAQKFGRRLPIALAFAWSTLYMGLCGIQRYRGLEAQRQIVAARNHDPEVQALFPTFPTNERWRSLYREGDMLYADLIVVPWWGEAQIAPGQSRVALERGTPPDEPGDSPRDVLRWFSKAWLYEDPVPEARPTEIHRLCDGRLSIDPKGFDGIFCFDIDGEGRVLRHRRPKMSRKNMDRLGTIFAVDPDLRPVSSYQAENYAPAPTP